MIRRNSQSEHDMKALFRPMTATILALAWSLAASAAEPLRAPATPVSEQVRKELLAARDTAWRSFFQQDPTEMERILAPEVIAIQESSERWEDRPRLLALAKGMKAQNVRVLRLEFPHTEIQLFGDVAILYYTYIFATGNEQASGTLGGRGTEVFVRRDGRWVDVGWHLDNGPFAQKNGDWVRTGAPFPATNPARPDRATSK
jgi:Domain of unknown function (DUF4440)